MNCILTRVFANGSKEFSNTIYGITPSEFRSWCETKLKEGSTQ